MTFEWMHLRLTLKTVQIKFLAADLLIGSRFPGVLLYFWRKKHQSEEKFFNRLRFTFMFTYFFPPLYCISKPTQFHLSLHLECRYVRETIHLVKGYISVSYTVAQRQRFTVYNSCTPDTCRQKTSSLQLLRTHIVPSLGQKKKRLSCITLPEGLNTAGENLSTICACN